MSASISFYVDFFWCSALIVIDFYVLKMCFKMNQLIGLMWCIDTVVITNTTIGHSNHACE